jgi:methylated-DNA-[protein]-cysteine S-methyltransferase
MDMQELESSNRFIGDPIMVTTKITHHYFSAVGWLELEFSSKGLRSISFVTPPEKTRNSLGNPMVAGLVSELDRYFAGEPVNFATPLDLHYGTDFQRRVWHQLMAIPYGKTWSYGEVAAAVGSPRGARAIGLANKNNCIPIIIPCHRVIRSDGSLGGYDSGLDIKEKLLRLETQNQPV